jgi:hypothetical protein
MNLSQSQHLNVVQECNQLVALWQDYRYHKSEMNKSWTQIRHICKRHGVDLRKPIVFLSVCALLWL